MTCWHHLARLHSLLSVIPLCNKCSYGHKPCPLMIAEWMLIVRLIDIRVRATSLCPSFAMRNNTCKLVGYHKGADAILCFKKLAWSTEWPRVRHYYVLRIQSEGPRERRSDLPGEAGATELRRDMASTAVSEPERMAVSMMDAALKEFMPFSLCSVMLPPSGSEPARQNPPTNFRQAETATIPCMDIFWLGWMDGLPYIRRCRYYDSKCTSCLPGYLS